MPLDINRLANQIFGDLATLYRTLPTETMIRDRDYFLRQFAHIISSRVITEFTTNANCSGTDSHGDTHDAVRIV